MKVSIFTSSRPRHLALLKKLARSGCDLSAVVEVVTAFPGVGQGFFRQSTVMKRYFCEVERAQRSYFGSLEFLPRMGRFMAIQMGDLNKLEERDLKNLLDAELFIVFGASIIKGWLIQELLRRVTVNIHIGLSPFYRGSSCNFWALADGNPEYVGATVHFLTEGLDDGPIIYHALPKFKGEDPFKFTMKSVVVAQDTLVDKIADKSILALTGIPQDRSKEIRYSRNADFTDQVAENFLNRNLSPEGLATSLETKEKPKGLIRPIFR